MVIFFGGLIGTGKTSLAKMVARTLQTPYYEVDKVKKEVVHADPRLEYNLKYNVPFPDEARMVMFNRAVEDFVELSKTNEHLIVDETLHKRLPRQILFDGAKKYFGGYIIIWVKTDEEIIRERLTSDERTEHILGDPFGMYLSLKKEFEEFDHVDIVFENSQTLDVAAERLTGLIREKLQQHLV